MKNIKSKIKKSFDNLFLKKTFIPYLFSCPNRSLHWGTDQRFNTYEATLKSKEKSLGLIISPFFNKNKRKKKSLIKKLSFDLLKKKSQNGTNFFISCKTLRIESPNCFYGCFYLGPFDPGQSMTIGNALRRTLLSELRGIAITSVEIDGALHEYSILPGLQDSVLDILLNLKEIILKKTTAFNFKKSQIGYIKAHGPGIVRAGDLLLPPFLQCVNPDQYIATLSEDGLLNIKLFINEGKNYSLFSESPSKKDSSFYKKKFSNSLLSTVEREEPIGSKLLKQKKGTKPPASFSGSSASHSVSKLEMIQRGSSSYLIKKDLELSDEKKEKQNETQKILSISKKSNKLFLDSVFMPVLKVNYIVEENKTVNDFLSAKKFKQNSFYKFTENIILSSSKKAFKSNEQNPLSALNTEKKVALRVTQKSKQSTSRTLPLWVLQRAPSLRSKEGGQEQNFNKATSLSVGGRLCVKNVPLFSYLSLPLQRPFSLSGGKIPFKTLKGSFYLVAASNNLHLVTQNKKSVTSTQKDISSSSGATSYLTSKVERKTQSGKITTKLRPTSFLPSKNQRPAPFPPTYFVRGIRQKRSKCSEQGGKTYLNNTKRIQSRLKLLQINRYIFNKTNKNVNVSFNIKKELIFYPLKEKIRKLYKLSSLTSGVNIKIKKSPIAVGSKQKVNQKQKIKNLIIPPFFSFFDRVSELPGRFPSERGLFRPQSRFLSSRMQPTLFAYSVTGGAPPSLLRKGQNREDKKLLLPGKQAINDKTKNSIYNISKGDSETSKNKKWKRIFKVNEIALQKKYIFNIKKNQYKKKYLSMLYALPTDNIFESSLLGNSLQRKGPVGAPTGQSEGRGRAKTKTVLKSDLRYGPINQKNQNLIPLCRTQSGSGSFRGGVRCQKEGSKHIYLMAKKNKISKNLYIKKSTINKRKKIIKKFSINNSRTAQDKIDFKHNLVLEIWTNGSIHPREALYKAIKILLTTFSKLKQIRFIKNFYKSKTTYKQFLSFFIRKWKKQKKGFQYTQAFPATK